MATSPIVSMEEPAACVTMEQFLERCKVSTETWQTFAEQLGDANFADVELFAAISDEDFKTTFEQSKVGILKRASLTRLFGTVKAKYGPKTRSVGGTSTVTKLKS